MTAPWYSSLSDDELKLVVVDAYGKYRSAYAEYDRQHLRWCEAQNELHRREQAGAAEVIVNNLNADTLRALIAMLTQKGG